MGIALNASINVEFHMTEESVQTSSLTEAQALRIAAARAAHAAGIAVMPLCVQSKKPARQGWQMAEFPDSAVTAEWARVANIGFRTGSISKGLVVIDCDLGADISCLGELPDTVTVLTGRTNAVTGQRGMHLYFRTGCALKNSVSKLCDLIDIRADNGYVVAPGSTHPETGLQYEFKPGFGLGEIEIAELPQHLLDRIEPKSKAEPVIELIGEAYAVLGLVGLQDHCLMQYLAATSRISQKPIYHPPPERK
jgi:hypothetical protein